MMPAEGTEDSARDNLEENLEDISSGVDPDFEDQPQDSRESLTRYSISTYGSDLEVEVLVKRLDEGRYIIPDYQRGYVWTRKRASKFIESLLVGLPIPGIFLYREEDKFLVIDGHQRLRSMQAFFSGKFPGSDKAFRLDGVSNEFDGKSYDDLSATDRVALDTAIIHASIIEQEQPNETDGASSIYHIFERINSGSVPLTPHEVRYCANYGDFAKRIKEWNHDSHWRTLIGKINTRMKDQEIILRFLALHEGIHRYEPPMQSFLDKYLRANRNPGSQFLQEKNSIFSSTVKFLASNVGQNVFRRTAPVNVAIADAILVVTAEGLMNQDLVENFSTRIEELKSDEVFKKATGSATSDKENVKLRIERARRFLRQ